ncbi:phage tail assembly chaperone [Pseudomonas sp. NPDC089422]|uniref:phage tail assembly chaperone n=1 Tax=Pseudomonas sp. NPDC089422 TaxID=3364466 RepID=UPI0038004737
MWARIANGLVMEVTDIDPFDRYHSELVWKECSLETMPGWKVVEGGYAPPSEMSEGELIQALRMWRDYQLQSSEWLVMRHRDELAMNITSSLSSGQYSELLTYRQSLRDWPTSSLFPDSSSKPEPPAWLALQTQ